MMEFNEKMIAQARTAKTPEELQALAEEHQIVLSEEQAREYFDQLNQSGTLADEELDNVVGGGLCDKGELNRIAKIGNCPDCGHDRHYSYKEYTGVVYPSNGGRPYASYNKILKCAKCGKQLW